MSIKNTLNEDMKTALKQKATLRLSTIRMVKAAIQNKEILLKSELNDDDVIALIQKEIKAYRESLDAFLNHSEKRLEEISTLQERINILNVYLPKQLSESDLKSLVKELIVQLKVKGVKDKGKLMKELMPKVKGVSEGSVVNKIVSSLLKELEG